MARSVALLVEYATCRKRGPGEKHERSLNLGDQEEQRVLHCMYVCNTRETHCSVGMTQSCKNASVPRDM